MMCKNFAHSGNTVAEYAIVLGLILVVSFYGFKILGPALSGNFTKASSTGNTLSLLQSPASGFGGSGSGSNSANTAQNTSGGGAGSSLPKASDIVPGNSNASIQVSGSNGDSGKIYGNAHSIMELASKYKDTDPAAYNLIIKLGLQGQSVAQSMVDLANSNQNQSQAIAVVGGGSAVANASAQASDNSHDYNTQSENYRNLWGMEVRTSPVFNSLSPADQKTLTSLAEESNVIMQNFKVTTTNAAKPATTVQADGAQTIQCGSGKC